MFKGEGSMLCGSMYMIYFRISCCVRASFFFVFLEKLQSHMAIATPEESFLSVFPGRGMPICSSGFQAKADAPRAAN